jgi:hypothetical protein
MKFMAIIVTAVATLTRPQTDRASCGSDFAVALLELLRTAFSVGAFCTISTITIKHLAEIEIFLKHVVHEAAKSNRGLIALGLLLLFLAILLYEMDKILPDVIDQF